MECNTLRSTSWTFEYGAHSYEDLKKSFQDSWEKHLQSLEKYNGTKEIGIFMIEYDESALGMIECVYTDWIIGMSQGDMRKQEDFKNYRLSRDKKILNYIYQFKDKIRYVIYVYRDGFEIIRTDNIPYFLKLMPWDYMIYPMIVQERQTMSCIRWEMKMSKLDEMIRELCPDGVEYVKLNSVCDIYDGTHSTPNYTESGVKFASVENIGNLYATRKYISEKDFKKYKIKPRIGDVMMTRIGSVGVCTVVDRNEALAFYVSLALLRPQLDKVQSRFLKYAIESIHGRKELRKRTLINAVPIKINKDDIGKVTIPLPPIEIQSEIVHTLDNYTENVVKLQNQLTAELTARQKQYTFYRNKLLTFSGNEKAKIVKISLGDIGPICMCKRILKSQTNTVEGVPFYKIGTFGKKADAYISKETFDEYRSKYSFPKKGDVLISAAGTIGRTVVYDGKPAYFQDSNIVWIDNNESVVLNSYLRYCYELKPWKASEGGTIPRLYNDNIAKAVIAVPSIEEQKRVVSILDRFDAICNDLTSGLPAEIEARQKQYEYYRDKLLSFKEHKNELSD